MRLKYPQIKATVVGNCGKSHTFNEWQHCEACGEVPYYKGCTIMGSYRVGY